MSENKSIDDMIDELTELFVDHMDSSDLIRMAYEVVRGNVESMGEGEIKAQWAEYFEEK